MRTPWRFVADLVSRKPKKDAADEGRSTDGEMRALEYKTATEEQILDVVPNTSAPPAEDDCENETGSASLAPIVTPEISCASDEMLDSWAEIGQPAAGAERRAFNAPAEETSSADLGRPQKRKPRKKSELAISGAAAVISSQMVSSVEPVVPKTFFEEMAEVDAEVDVLRRQLLKKLAEQNAQLRKMLARFETR